ncbi:nucleotide-binding alpha-beta plait domain-containing protein [Artemisia annua]|uniref:DNA-directed RNA polymerase n=1 Tax=Artemisia annua TaxID=35608 RepID=A0A2U1N023_ARTAN|nr:nucleotide-binding alpha-beta plait domain-containing protein [Artemisia annua]
MGVDNSEFTIENEDETDQAKENIRLRPGRNMLMGDKFSSRHGQKGINDALAVVTYEDLTVILGSTLHTTAVEGSDTIALNNIDNKWNNENVLALLQKVGITKIDEVLIVHDPENTELNCAFIEFGTKRDA